MAKQPESNQSRPVPAPPNVMPEKITIPTNDLQPAVVPLTKKPLATVGPEIRKTRTRSQSAMLTVPEIDDEGARQTELTVTDHLHRNRKPLSSLLVSLIVHTSLIVVLALLVFNKPDDSIISFTAEVTNTPDPEVAAMDLEKIEIVAPDEDQSELELKQDDLSVDTEQLAPQINNSLIQMPSDHENPAQAEELAPIAPNQTLPTGGGLKGRDAEARSRLAGTRGGSQESEQAVEDGLRWIVNHQREDGSWRLLHQQGDCNGRCKNPGTRESTTAATGLALMALLGAGYTHQVGPYQSEVRKGLDYLKSQMRIGTYGGNLAEGSMYAQGIATIALSEAYIMTKDAELRVYIEQAMKYIVNAQHKAGGWRYNPGQPGDMTVTGWQLMALKSCALGGFEVPRETWEKARTFLDSKGESGGSYYGYQKPGIEPVSTAVGLLSQMYLGWPRERAALQTGSERLADWGPSKVDVYFNYYSTQVLHHLRTPVWDEWNPQLRDYLVQTQDKRGHQSGSWYFRQKHGKNGGRLYTTAMSVMILEVYYRYLPLYDDRAVD